MKKYRVKINGKVFHVELEAIEEVNEPVKEVKQVKEEKVNKEAKVEGCVDILAPIQGNVINVLVKTGDKVKKGDVLLLIEAMKLENEVNAISDGEVVEVLVKKGETVTTNQLLVKIK